LLVWERVLYLHPAERKRGKSSKKIERE